jgi:hypothetical protein
MYLIDRNMFRYVMNEELSLTMGIVTVLDVLL